MSIATTPAAVPVETQNGTGHRMFQATDYRTAFAAFLLLGFALLAWRWMGRSHYLIDWDAVNYALGLSKYDVRHDQPHIPGYFLYIYLGRLFLPIAGEANRALVWVSALFGGLCAWMLYLLGRDMFDRRVAALSALCGITSPILWYQSNVASSRTAEGFFGLLVAWLCARVRWRNDMRALWGLAVALAIAAGIRQQIAPFLLPLCIWATWQVPLKRRIGVLALFLGLCLLWAIPMLRAVGGITAYRTLSKAQWDLFVVGQTGVFWAPTLHDGLRRFVENNSRILLYAGYTLPLGLFLLPLAIREAARRRLLATGQRVHFLLCATLPSLLFFSFLHIQQTGHAMSYAPFFIVSVVYGWRRLPARYQVPAALALVGANLLFVYGAPSYLGASGRLMTPSNATIRRNDLAIDAVNRQIASHLRTDDSLILATDGIFRTLDFYAPDYALLSPALASGATPAFNVVTHKAIVVQPQNGNIAAPASARTFLIAGTSALPRLDRAARRVEVTPPRGLEAWAVTYPEGVDVEEVKEAGLTFLYLHTPGPVHFTLQGRTVQLQTDSSASSTRP